MAIQSNTFAQKVVQPQMEEKGKKWFEILVVLITSLAGMTAGALGAWAAPYMIKIVKDEKYDINEEQAAYFGIMNLIGFVTLGPITVPIIEHIGRKKGALIAVVPYIISWLMKAFVTNIWGLYFARIIVGAGDAFMMSCGPIYIAEITSPEVRGVWGNSFYIAIIFGSFVINLLGIYLNVTVTSILFIALQLIFLFIFPYMPESPYFLISNGKDEEAKESLRKLRRTDNINNDFKEIKAGVERQLAISGTWKDLFTNRVNRKALFIGSFLRTTQVFAGLPVFFAYIQFIFNKANVNINPNMSSILYTGLNFAVYTCASYGSNKLGRRRSLMISVMLCAIIFFLQGTYFVVDKNFPEVNLEHIQWFPLLGMVLFLLFSSVGLGPLPTLMQGELYAATIKSKAVAFVGILFAFEGIIMNNLFFYINLYFGLGGPFYMFAITCFISFFIMYRVIPETKDKTLEEIQLALAERKQ